MAKTISRCANCGRPLTQPRTGRPRKWCSRYCRQRGYDRRRLDAAREAGRAEAIEEQRGRTYLA